MKQAELARALGVSQSMVSRLLQQGMPGDLEGARRWRAANLNIAQRKPEPAATASQPPAPPPRAESPPLDDESHDQARTRREIAEANLAELKLAEQRGELVRAAAVRHALARKVASLRESFLQMPARVVPLLAADPSPASMDRILRGEIVASLAAFVSSTGTLRSDTPAPRPDDTAEPGAA